jgi:hypothetical protein
LTQTEVFSSGKKNPAPIFAPVKFTQNISSAAPPLTQRQSRLEHTNRPLSNLPLNLLLH